MTAVVPLLAEALNLAITEHWGEMFQLEIHHSNANWCREHPAVDVVGGAAKYDDKFSAGVEALACRLRARLQEQGTLT